MGSQIYSRALSFIFLFYFISLSLGQRTYNVRRFGAKADGRSDSTQAFTKVWTAACAKNSAVTIYIPQGRYVLRSITFSGLFCKSKAITFRIDGTLVAPSNYKVIGWANNWLMFHQVRRVFIYGGTLDARGTGLWKCKMSGNWNCPQGATTLGIYNSRHVVVKGLTSLNSQRFHVIVHKSRNVKLQGMKINAPHNSPNTDGIHVEYSSGVTIKSSRIATGDDCISIGRGASNMLIQSITCGPGHGISIGSLGWDFQEPGVENIVVKKVIFKGTENGFRVKTWARPSNGYVRNVLFQGGVMINVKNPIDIDQYYCPSGSNCLNQASGVKISGVTFADVRGTSANPVALNLRCSKEDPCSQITLQNVNLVHHNNQPTIASCSNVGGRSFGVINPPGCL